MNILNTINLLIYGKNVRPFLDNDVQTGQGPNRTRDSSVAGTMETDSDGSGLNGTGARITVKRTERDGTERVQTVLLETRLQSYAGIGKSPAR